MFHEQMSHLECRKWLFKLDEMRILRKFIYHHQYAIGIRRDWQTFYEVHGDNLPGLIRDSKGLQ
jgi:hypothetical protein